MNLKNITLNKKSQTQKKYMLHDSINMEFKNRKY